VDSGDVLRGLAIEARHDGREAAGKQSRAVAAWVQQGQVMTSCGSDLGCGLDRRRQVQVRHIRGRPGRID
jgi:hypothetical protein